MNCECRTDTVSNDPGNNMRKVLCQFNTFWNICMGRNYNPTIAIDQSWSCCCYVSLDFGVMNSIPNRVITKKKSQELKHTLIQGQKMCVFPQENFISLPLTPIYFAFPRHYSSILMFIFGALLPAPALFFAPALILSC